MEETATGWAIARFSHWRFDNSFFLTITFSVVAGLGSTALAQNPGQRTPPAQPPSAEQQGDQGESVTLVGCLAKGDTEDQYVITENKSGRKLAFGGPNQLQKYLNQTVQLTGTLMNNNGEKSFHPESLKPVSPSCETSNGR
jgi:hypothetical protein